MRIITGEYKGRQIASVKGANIRYTSDRLKESLFSILRESVVGSHFLDLYAGSGNVGIEALSRGADSVTFVDINPFCIKTIESNLQKCGVTAEMMLEQSRVRILKTEAFRSLGYFQRHGARFDLIFLDPPYAKGFVERTIQEISTGKILSENGRIIAEHDVKEAVRSPIGGFIMDRQEKYGLTLLSFFGNQ